MIEGQLLEFFIRGKSETVVPSGKKTVSRKCHGTIDRTGKFQISLPKPFHGEGIRIFAKTRIEQMCIKQLEQQRRAARSGRAVTRGQQAEVDTSSSATGYVLDVMVQKSYGRALDWEMGNMIEPVDVPLFAKVLRDREAKRIARLDSIEQARVDSIARLQRAADSAAVADSVRADSVSATAAKTPPDTTAAGSAVKAGTGEAPSAAGAPAAAPNDTTGPARNSPPGGDATLKTPQEGAGGQQKTGGAETKQPDDGGDTNATRGSPDNSDAGNP